MQLTPEAIVGLIALFGIAMLAILIMLKRFGIISFGNSAHYHDYEAFHTSFIEVRDENLRHCQILERHEKQLEESKEIFNCIKRDNAQIKISIALIIQKLNIKSRSLNQKQESI